MLDKPKNTVSGPPEGITLRDKQMTALKMLESVLDNSDSLLKLYLVYKQARSFFSSKSSPMYARQPSC